MNLDTENRYLFQNADETYTLATTLTDGEDDDLFKLSGENPTLTYSVGEGNDVIINADGSDEIYAGDGSKDIFIGSKNQGADLFLNVSSSDEVQLSDVTLNDIIKIDKSDDMITVSLKTGIDIIIKFTKAQTNIMYWVR